MAISTYFLLLAIVAVAMAASAFVIPDAEATFERSLQPTFTTRATSPSAVKDGKATYQGSCSNGVCTWKGIQYARAPIGDLRFAPARDPTTPSGTIDATKYGPQCLQSGSGTQSEDCLFVNIQRPSNVGLNTKLPVLLFVHGGGFQTGAGSNQDATAMVMAGSNANLPAIVMTINYRLGLFGFLGGSTFSSRQNANRNDVSLNAAFTDVRQALKWAKGHVSAFGGDPAKITLWGQSAGSFASAAQMLGSYTKPNFAGVILESGSPGGVPIDPPSQKDGQYNDVLSSAGCAGASDTVACLRGVSAASLRTISIKQSNLNSSPNTTPRGYYSWTPVQDGGPSKGGFYTDRPSVVIKKGRFAAVPLLHGDCYDEGTYFAYQGSNSDVETFDYFKRIYFSDASANLLTQALQQYPDDPVVGSPYLPHDGDYSDRFYGALNQYKRIASLYGDIRYQSNRRFFMNAVASKGVRAYSYEFAQYTPGNADSVGYPHGSDVSYVFNTQSDNPFNDILARQWLSFATYQTPNKAGGSTPHWYQYTSSSKRVLYYANNTITSVNDNFRAGPIDFLNRADVLAATGR